ncbi:hypothetical protein [Macrococcus armenti]|uniref:hypothetical protein n=1 Tax=Macrococcus armenti TaxID=2875764 RepID=UPI001CC92915|nr:hypothetical protein [Macrococcus armenti]UBH16386.1 hypothetical protein LAU44_05370 [Macrococcus armenti]UBH18742.1 hypothetical protein LAU39_05380 [Macrococcus armenti]UBH21014.1 hypothetical protein LAU40_05375 [Macrococcus armenti]
MMKGAMKWQLLKVKAYQYSQVVEDMKKRKGIIAMVELKKHQYFVKELNHIIADIEKEVENAEKIEVQREKSRV